MCRGFGAFLSTSSVEKTDRGKSVGRRAGQTLRTLEGHDDLVGVLPDPALEERERVDECAAVHHPTLALAASGRARCGGRGVVQAGVAREVNRLDGMLELLHLVREKRKG